MALNASTLGSLIYSNWSSDPNNGFSPSQTAAQIALEKALCNQIAAAVVTHIQAAAVVSVNVNVTVPGTGLVAPPTGGPVTGAASGSGSGSGTIS